MKLDRIQKLRMFHADLTEDDARKLLVALYAMYPKLRLSQDLDSFMNEQVLEWCSMPTSLLMEGVAILNGENK